MYSSEWHDIRICLSQYSNWDVKPGMRPRQNTQTEVVLKHWGLFKEKRDDDIKKTKEPHLLGLLEGNFRFKFIYSVLECLFICHQFLQSSPGMFGGCLQFYININRSITSQAKFESTTSVSRQRLWAQCHNQTGLDCLAKQMQVSA